MTHQAQALILDFGGVITRTMFETHGLSEAALGLPKGSLSWQGPFAPEADPLWQDMQADRITERNYWQKRTTEVARLIGADWSEMSDFVKAARGADPLPIIRPEALSAIDIVAKAGIKLAVLSNELDLFYGAAFREKLPFLKDFDVISDATYTGILKPDARAYQACLTALDLSAEACVFVDDQRRNIEGAARIGLRTVHFDVKNPRRSYEQALKQLGLKLGEPA